MMLKKLTVLVALVILLVSCGKDKAPPAPNAPVWTEKPSLPDKRAFHVSVVIGDKSYVFGGYDGKNNVLSVWEFDPKSSQWTKKAFLPDGKNGASAFVLNGKGYLVGGNIDPFNVSESVWEFDPSGNNNKGTWTTKTPLPSGRGGASAFVLNGKGYVVGGYTKGNIVGSVWEFDPSGNNNNGTWVAKTPLPAGNERHSAMGFALNGKGYVVGGYNKNGVVADVWEFDPSGNNNKGTWTVKTPLLYGIANAAAFVIGGKGYIAGGNINDNSSLSSMWEFDPLVKSNKGAWTEKISLPIVIKHTSGFALNGKGYVVGGETKDNKNIDIYTNSFLEFNPEGK